MALGLECERHQANDLSPTVTFVAYTWLSQSTDDWASSNRYLAHGRLSKIRLSKIFAEQRSQIVELC